ncbi:MAG: HEPN domain-containing protein [Desulfobacteraceae bacterium]|nr:MAG: HEPN domain-containing protein [Desulfobacteraceae bacterium]
MKEGTKSWIAFADRDLEAAKSLLENEYIANIVLFHCQQCIEKCLKAILEEHEIQVPKIHSVVRLFGVITENIELEFKIDEDALNLVDDIYIDTRYPSGLGLLPSGFPSKEEAAEVLKIAKNIYDNVLLYLGREG